MKAVVLSVKNNKAAVAFKGGTLKYIDDMGYERGQILNIPLEEEVPLTVHEGGKKRFSLFSRYASSAAAAASVLLLTGAVTAYALPVSTVTIDVNPSLSLGINILDRVVRADYGNEDGRELLQDISPELMGRKLPDAVNIVFDGMEELDYINGEDIPAASTVTGIFPERNRDRMMDELRSSADRWNKAHKDRSVSFEVERMTPELKKEAGEKGMTPGQLMLERRKPAPEPVYPEEPTQDEPPSGVPEYDSAEDEESETEKNSSVNFSKEDSGFGNSPKEDYGSGRGQETLEPPEDSGYSGGEKTPENPDPGKGQGSSADPVIPGGQAPENPDPGKGQGSPGDSVIPGGQVPEYMDPGSVQVPENPDPGKGQGSPADPGFPGGQTPEYTDPGSGQAPEYMDPGSGQQPQENPGNPGNPDNGNAAAPPENPGGQGGEPSPENPDSGNGQRSGEHEPGGGKEGGGHGSGGGGKESGRKK